MDIEFKPESEEQSFIKCEIVGALDFSVFRFHVMDQVIMDIKPTGEIYYKGKLIDTDKDLVEEIKKAYNIKS